MASRRSHTRRRRAGRRRTGRSGARSERSARARSRSDAATALLNDPRDAQPARRARRAYRARRPWRPLSVGLPRMTAQPCGRFVDAADVRPDGLTTLAPRHDEVAIVRLSALQVVDHQVAAVRLDRQLEAFHGRQQVHQIFGALSARHGDPAGPQASADFGSRRAALLGPMRVETALQVLVLVHTRCYSRLSVAPLWNPSRRCESLPD